MQNIIDLRKQPELLPPKKELLPSARKKSISEYEEAYLQWTAPEYEKQSYTTRWFLVVGGFALLLILAAILAQNYFFLAFTVLAFFVTVMYVKRIPRDITFAIAKEGIHMGHKIFLWNSIKSFWIFEKSRMRELSLETDKTLIPFIRISLLDVDTERIRGLLKKFIPEKEHREFIADEIGKNFGF